MCKCEMKAGRELDELVAEKVMDVLDNADPSDVPHYSTDIADAWSVVDRIGGKVYVEMCLWNDTGDDACWCATFGHALGGCGWIEDGGASGKTAPEAICLAALQVVGATTKGGK